MAYSFLGSVADHRKVGLGHGNLGKMLLEEEKECFCFLAGHESFAAAEGAIGIAEKANKVRKKPLRVNLCTKSLRIGFTEYFLNLVLIWIILCLYICKSVDTGDDLSSS